MKRAKEARNHIMSAKTTPQDVYVICTEVLAKRNYRIIALHVCGIDSHLIWHLTSGSALVWRGLRYHVL